MLIIKGICLLLSHLPTSYTIVRAVRLTAITLFVYSTLFILLFPQKNGNGLVQSYDYTNPFPFIMIVEAQPAATASCFCWQTGVLGAHEGLFPLNG